VAITIEWTERFKDCLILLCNDGLYQFKVTPEGDFLIDSPTLIYESNQSKFIRVSNCRRMLALGGGKTDGTQIMLISTANWKLVSKIKVETEVIEMVLSSDYVVFESLCPKVTKKTEAVGS